MSCSARKLVAAPTVIAAIALIAPAAGLGAGIGVAKVMKATSVSISSSVPAFHGRVTSSSKTCESNRRVQLYRKRVGKNPNRLGGDVTSGSGRWEVTVDSLKSGAYYAKAKHSSGCAGARSELALID